MDRRFFFILGSHPGLSLVEIHAVVGQHEAIRPTALGSDYLLADGGKEIDLEAVTLKLGGVVKAGVVMTISTREDLTDCVHGIIVSRFDVQTEGKHFFGISVYGQARGIKRLNSTAVRSIAIQVKKRLKAQGFSVRWVESREGPALSSVVVKTNHLLEQRGCEVVIFEAEGDYHVGYTVAVQPFAEYSARDYGRPGRDSRSGMLPPKVARMMMNLAQVQECGTILDPFCGSGTVLQEGLLMGYQMIGSDVSEKAVADSEQNLNWLIDAYKLPSKSPDKVEDAQQSRHYKLTQYDVRELSKHYHEKVDAVVTEPYLGPQHQSGLSDLDRVMRELGVLYLAAFREFARVIKPGRRVVFIFPFFIQKNQTYFLPDSLFKEIGFLGFEVVNLRKTILEQCANLSISSRILDDLTERGSVLYRRLDQRVGREIFVFKRQ